MASPQKPKSSVKRTLRSYAETTTVKGVPKVLKSQKLPLKILWFSAVVIGGSMAAYQLAILLIKYFQYPTTTKLKEVQDRPGYPDITLCNLNPLPGPLVENISTVTPDDYNKVLIVGFMKTS